MTNRSEKINEDDGDLMTIEDYMDSVACGLFIDYDGMGDAVKDGYYMNRRSYVYPSKLGKDIPEGATHILWYNR